MNEMGEGAPITIEAGKIPAIDEKFDHTGRRFESPEADKQLAFVRDKIASQRILPTAIDLLDIVRCEIEDVQEQKKYVMGGKKELDRTERGLKAVQETLLHTAAYEYDKISMMDKTNVLNYIDRQKQRWELRPEDPNAIENQKVFALLHENLFSSEAQKDDTDVETATNEEATPMEQSSQSEAPEMFPEYTYAPDKASAVLKNFVGKKITIKDAPTFYSAVAEDLEQQENAFREKYPGWVEKKTAVGAATHFYSKHVDEAALSDKQILVSLQPDGAIHMGWELSSKNPDAKNFVFTLTGNNDDPKDLGKHIANVSYFDTRRKNIELAKIAAEKLVLGEKLEFPETHALLIYTDLHQQYLNAKDEQTKSDKKELEVVKGLARKVKKKIGLPTDEG